MTTEQSIRKCIEKAIDNNINKFIIFPYGDIGRQVNDILNNVYNIKASYIIDNHLCKYNQDIRPLSYLKNLDTEGYAIILASTNKEIYEELKSELLSYVSVSNIFEFFVNKKVPEYPMYITTIGKYSYGPLCKNHPNIESIGNFCSFAPGVDVVDKHDVNFITTHPIINGGHLPIEDYSKYNDRVWYFDGIQPHKTEFKHERITIGHDVWLGRNVTITNYSNIGNGVIAGAGAVITKDVPDYAVVAGVPARIIRYRYTPEQIEALNKIQWWNWSDEEIRERFDDLYLPIDEFIQKYININK